MQHVILYAGYLVVNQHANKSKGGLAALREVVLAAWLF